MSLHQEANDRKKKWRKRIIRLLIVYGVVALFGYFLGSYLKYDSNPEACGSCHAMQPQFKTWQITSHNNVECTECHKNIQIATFKFREQTNRYRIPVENDFFIEDEICLQCHNPRRIVTPPGDLVIPHTLHMEKSVDCIDCHETVAHADVNNQVIAAQGLPPAEFTTAMAEELASHGNRIPMSKCMECHNGAKAPADCGTCHTDKDAPLSHMRGTWDTVHGLDAFADINSCNQCHEYDIAKKQAYDEDQDVLVNVRREARTNGFCRNCHIQRPVTHVKPYSVKHPPKAREFSEGCLACHDRDAEPIEGVPEPTTNVYCSQCHFTLHPSTWVVDHRQKVRDDGDATCYECHAATSCASCHANARNL